MWQGTGKKRGRRGGKPAPKTKCMDTSQPSSVLLSYVWDRFVERVINEGGKFLSLVCIVLI